MAEKFAAFLGIFLVFLFFSKSGAEGIPPSLRSSFPRAISDLKEAIIQGLGVQANGVELSGFDPRDAKVGQSMVYEFHVEIDRKVIPIKLLEDVSRWEFDDFSSIPMNGEAGEKSETGLAWMNNFQEARVLPVLPPFQLEGPMELWIQDGDDVRLALPHDVEAGVLKKVMLSDGAKVTVTGAKSVALRHPLSLPLPLNRTRRHGAVASSLLTMAAALRHAARSSDKPLLSLKIVGPTSLSSERLKLKRLAHGLVELSSASVPALTEKVNAVNPPFLWPLSSLNGSDSTLRGFEELLSSVLGKKGAETGTFRLLKADVSATTYVKLGFSVKRPVSGMDVDWSNFPSWKTKPENIRTRFEVLARVTDDGKIVPERIAEVPPVPVVEPPAPAGNFSGSRRPVYHPPPDYFAL